jgi:hypothetical protein
VRSCEILNVDFPIVVPCVIYGCRPNTWLEQRSNIEKPRKPRNLGCPDYTGRRSVRWMDYFTDYFTCLGFSISVLKARGLECFTVCISVSQSVYEKGMVDIRKCASIWLCQSIVILSPSSKTASLKPWKCSVIPPPMKNPVVKNK